MKTSVILTTIFSLLSAGAVAKPIFVKKQNDRVVVMPGAAKGCMAVNPTEYGNGVQYLTYADGGGFETSCDNESYVVAVYDLALLPEAECWELHDVKYTTCNPSGLKDVQLDLYSYEIKYAPQKKKSTGNQYRQRYDGVAITTTSGTYSYGGQVSVYDSKNELGAGSTQLTGLEVETSGGDKITPYLSYNFYSWLN